MRTTIVEKGEFNFLIRANDVAAISIFRGNDPAQYYLNGVFVESKELEGAPRIQLTATDGCALLTKTSDEIAFIGDGCLTDRRDQKGFILAIDNTEKAFKRKTIGELWIYGDMETGIASFVDIRAKDLSTEVAVVCVCQFSVVDGTFPSYSRIIPAVRKPDAALLDRLISGQLSTGETMEKVRQDIISQMKMPVSCFNGDYISKFVKARKLICGDKSNHIALEYTGDDPPSPVKVAFPDCPDLMGILMPMRP